MSDAAVPGKPAAVRALPRRSLRIHAVLWFMAACLCLGMADTSFTQEAPNRGLRLELPDGIAGGPEHWTSPEGLSSALQVMLLLTVISLAPAILLMTTCFVRVIVVLGLLRQALGTQQLPPSQVITSIALFLTLLLMTPVWKKVYDDGIAPYTQKKITLSEAWTAGAAPSDAS